MMSLGQRAGKTPKVTINSFSLCVTEAEPPFQVSYHIISFRGEEFAVNCMVGAMLQPSADSTLESLPESMP